MNIFFQEFRIAIRSLRKSPGFAAVAILTLAIGIGANASIFSVANAVLFRALPYTEPDRVVTVLYGGENPAAPAEYFAWKSQNTVFDRMSAAEYWTPNLTGTDRPEQLSGIRVSDNLFQMLGVRPALGRAFTDADQQPDGATFVVLGDKLWKRRFGSDPNVIGRTLTMDGRNYQVIGVMPQGFEFPLFWAARAEMWAPLPLENRRTSADRSLRIFARLKPGATIEQARAEMTVLAQRGTEATNGSRAEAPVQVIPLQDKVVGNVKSALALLLAMAGFVLLIVCANAANLLLVRGNSRQREMAVRTAMGATRGRLIRQLLIENALLALAGSGAGLAIAYWSVAALANKLPAGLLPRQDNIAIDGPVLAFVLLLAITATFIFGMIPAFHASRADVQNGLKETSRSTGGQQTHWRRRFLASAEVAIALVLLVGAGLMTRSFARLHAVDPGFTTNNILTMTVSVAGTKQSPAANRATFYRDVVERTRALPGVQGASLINHLPLGGDVWTFGFSVEGTPAKPDEQPAAAYRVVMPDYFRTMQISLHGRDFTAQDKAGAPNVVIVNEELAQRYFPGADPVGKRIKLGAADSKVPWLSIVGVVPSVKQGSWTEKPGSEVYLPLLQSDLLLSNPGGPFSYMTLVVRGGPGVSSLTAPIRSQIGNLEPNAPISNVTTMDEVVADQLARARASTVLMSSLAAIGLVLAMIGVYGVMSYSVSLRTQEIGLRTALGARPGDVLGMIVKEGMMLTAAGVAAGTFAAIGLTRLMQGLLFEVSATDPVTFVAAAALLAIVVFAACSIPAWRALRVDPIVALRNP